MRPQEFFVKLGRRRGHMFEIAKNSAGIQPGINLSVECPLPFVNEMMNSETGDHRVKLPNSGRGSSRLWATTVTERSSAKRLRAASSMAGEKSIGHRRDIRMVQFDQCEQTVRLRCRGQEFASRSAE